MESKFTQRLYLSNKMMYLTLYCNIRNKLYSVYYLLYTEHYIQFYFVYSMHEVVRSVYHQYIITTSISECLRLLTQPMNHKTMSHAI